MKAAEIRELFLSFFEERGHLRMPSASLVPPSYDPSVLLTTAGMQPFKPYFRGEEEPPSKRLTSCQKSFRTVDIEVVGTTKRHLTFFEMLGNFSVGDYFKQGAAEYAWELSTEGFGFDPDKIWISVFGGDEGLGLGPDSEAIQVWRSIGVPDDRIVLLGREDNFWQAGPTGPCGPCSELYFDRGPDYGPDTDRPGDDTREPAGGAAARGIAPQDNGSAGVHRDAGGTAALGEPGSHRDEAAAKVHIVQPGDTLWDIAASNLPRAQRTNGPIAAYWQRIYEANRDTIGADPDRIYPGATLTIPAPADSNGTSGR